MPVLVLAAPCFFAICLMFAEHQLFDPLPSKRGHLQRWGRHLRLALERTAWITHGTPRESQTRTPPPKCFSAACAADGHVGATSLLKAKDRLSVYLRVRNEPVTWKQSSFHIHLIDSESWHCCWNRRGHICSLASTQMKSKAPNVSTFPVNVRPSSVHLPHQHHFTLLSESVSLFPPAADENEQKMSGWKP